MMAYFSVLDRLTAFTQIKTIFENGLNINFLKTPETQVQTYLQFVWIALLMFICAVRVYDDEKRYSTEMSIHAFVLIKLVYKTVAMAVYAILRSTLNERISYNA